MQREPIEEVREFSVHLHVLDKKTMSKFIHFELTEVPQFTFPAQNTNFQLGYFVEGQINKKFHMVDRCTLQSAYDAQVNGKLSLWVDRHIQNASGRSSEKGRKTGNNKKKRGVTVTSQSSW